MDDRRKFVRLVADVEITWKKYVPPQEASSIFSDSTRNISAGGICFITNEKINQDDILELTIKLPTAEIIRAKGKTVWINEYRIVGDEAGSRYEAGVEFLDIADSDKEKISLFVFRGISGGRAGAR